MAIGKRRATYDDLCKVPDTMVAEIVDGELFTTRSAVGMAELPFDIAVEIEMILQVA